MAFESNGGAMEAAVGRGTRLAHPFAEECGQAMRPIGANLGVGARHLWIEIVTG